MVVCSCDKVVNSCSLLISTGSDEIIVLTVGDDFIVFTLEMGCASSGSYGISSFGSSVDIFCPDIGWDLDSIACFIDCEGAWEGVGPFFAFSVSMKLSMRRVLASVISSFCFNSAISF